MFDLVCPVCGKSEIDERYRKDSFYLCVHRKSIDSGICGTIIGIGCKKCKNIYNADHFGLRGDVYECKECGQPQWGYTQYIRDHAAIRKEMADYLTSINNIINNL